MAVAASIGEHVRVHLVVIVGPIAVGKMTVGRELSTLTDYPLFHNHMTVEPLAEIFPFGSEPYGRLVRQIRAMVIDEAVVSGLPGLILTFVMDFDDPGDADFLAHVVAPALEAGGTVDFVELYADQPTRLCREGTELRLAHKRSKRDVERARELLVQIDARARLNTAGEAFPLPGRHLRIDNSRLAPDEVARTIVDRLELRTD